MPLVRHTPSQPASSSVPLDAPPASAALLDILLHDPDNTARRQAATDLTGLEATDGLVTALGQETCLAVREAIVTSLIAIGTETAAAGLAACLHSEDVMLRNSAIEALQQMSTAAGSHIETLLASKDPDVRLFSVNILELLRHPDNRKWLHSALERDPEVNVGLAAVEALAQFGDADDVAVLRGFAARFPDQPFVEFAVDLACRRVAGGRV